MRSMHSPDSKIARFGQLAKLNCSADRIFERIYRKTSEPGRRVEFQGPHKLCERVGSAARTGGRLGLRYEADQKLDGGAKKQRRLPSGRLQRQYAPSGEGWASSNGTVSRLNSRYPVAVMCTCSVGTVKQSPSPQHHSPAALRRPPREIQLSWAGVWEQASRTR